MSFSLNDFISKIEAHFGRSPTRFLLLAVYLAVLSVCVSLVWSRFLHPAWRVIEGVAPAHWTLAAAGQTLFYLLEVLAVFGFASTILDAYRQRLAREEIDGLMSRTHEAMKDVREARREALDDLHGAREYFLKAEAFAAIIELTVEAVLQDAERTGLVDPEAAKTLGTLLADLKNKIPKID